MDDGAVARRRAQLALFADLRWPQVEAVAHTFDEAVFAAGQRRSAKSASWASLRATAPSSMA